MPSATPGSRALQVEIPKSLKDSAASQTTSGGLSKKGCPARYCVAHSPRTSMDFATAA
jgi:hypothetical protein